MLQEIHLPRRINDRPIPAEILDRLAVMRTRVETFEDSWNQHHAAQFVAADYELVFQAIDWLLADGLVMGRRFVEWGCGFATVACLADWLGLDAWAIEAHADLLSQAQQTIEQWSASVELFDGNFLPRGAEELALDPTLPSLGHGHQPAYECWGVDLDDFALVYSYPWPGEDEFHEDVFDKFASPGAVLLMFIGPNEMRAWRKQNHHISKTHGR